MQQECDTLLVGSAFQLQVEGQEHQCTDRFFPFLQSGTLAHGDMVLSTPRVGLSLSVESLQTHPVLSLR